MRMQLISFDRVKDLTSKEPISVIMFAEEVTEIELGLYVRWANMWHDKGEATWPVGSFVNTHIHEVRGERFKSKEELLRELPVFEEKYGISLHAFVVRTIVAELIRNKALSGRSIHE